MGRGQPGPGGQLFGAAEAGDIADLGDEHRREDRPDPGNLLDREVAGSARNRPATSRANRSTSKSNALISRSIESTRARDSTASPVATSSLCPPGPNRSLRGTCTPTVGDHEIPQAGGVGDHVIPHPAIT
jgi:hypothetical protein